MTIKNFHIVLFIIIITQFNNCQTSIEQSSTNKLLILPMNKLKNELSPYLLQHASNPVNWYPWGDEAFQLAKKLNRPIFLSIGYSTCHWCHVMAHESFEDIDVAKLLNDNFIAIKVDREERPEIDHLYMSVCQAMTGRGGWPLTIIMTPDKKPFFAGTYFPKETRGGMPGMMQLLPSITQAWENNKDKIDQTIAQVENYLNNANSAVNDEKITKDIIDISFKQYSSSFDKINGGFRGAPKFPAPHNLIFLLRYYQMTKDQSALDMVEKTLSKMQQGGIFDHIGYGFHRYSTDSKWLVPHFEKMLYDQAMIALAYTELYQITKQIKYAKTAQEIFEYVLRDMTHPDGGFYSAEDADSDGIEGKFYLWTEAEIVDVLGIKDAELFNSIFNISTSGNFQAETGHNVDNSNIPHLTASIITLSAKYGKTEDELTQFINKSKEKLFTHREQRIRPHKDDKILTDWNGLMIAALAKGAVVFKSEEYLNAAEKAVVFINKELMTDSKRLKKRFRNGKSGLDGHIDDYAFYIWGLLELYEANFEPKHLDQAIQLTNVMIDDFWDTENSGFFMSSKDGEQLLVRSKTAYDSAIPSGNSVAAMILQRLGRITGNTEWIDMSYKIFATFADDINRSPNGFGAMLSAYIFANNSPKEVIIVGDGNSDRTIELLSAIQSEYFPNKVIIFKDLSDKQNQLSRIADWTMEYRTIDGKPTVYICKNYTCNQPTTDIQTALKQLQE